MDDAERQRQAAGEHAASMVEDGMVIGYGTGREANANQAEKKERPTHGRASRNHGRSFD